MDATISPTPDAASFIQWQPATIANGLGATATLVFNRAGNVYGIVAENPNAYTVYLQFFDQAAAGSVTLGTTVPDYVVPVPAGGFVDDLLPMAIRHFKNGCVIAATKTVSGNDAIATALKVPTIHYR